MAKQVYLPTHFFHPLYASWIQFAQLNACVIYLIGLYRWVDNQSEDTPRVEWATSSRDLSDLLSALEQILGGT